MRPKLKRMLILSAKHAVNAILTNSVLMTTLGSWSQIHTRGGWWTIGKVALSTIVAREAMVWGPKLLAWSQSTGKEEQNGG